MRRWLYAMREFGFDPTKTLRAIRGIPQFLFGLLRFVRKNKNSLISISPTLLDFNDNAGAADGHYFWQDLICAQWIFNENPSTHFDVGSRVDGFVAHLLSFRKVISLDIRPLRQTIPGLSVVLGNAQLPIQPNVGQFDSVSSLHSVEHFGLGRYGDEIDPNGHLKGIRNIADCVKPGGVLYLSFPIGKTKVQFNAQRILSPTILAELLTDFSLEDFVLIPWRGEPKFNTKPGEVDLNDFGQAGLYKLRRILEL